MDTIPLKLRSSASWKPEPALLLREAERRKKGGLGPCHWVWITLVASFAALYLSSDLAMFRKWNDITPKGREDIREKNTRSFVRRTTAKPSSPAQSIVTEQKEKVPRYDENKVRIWSPDLRACRGRFIVPSLNQSIDNPPILMLREAVVDMRHNSLQETNAKQIIPMPFLRIVAHVSAA